MCASLPIDAPPSADVRDTPSANSNSRRLGRGGVGCPPSTPPASCANHDHGAVRRPAARQSRYLVQLGCDEFFMDPCFEAVTRWYPALMKALKFLPPMIMAGAAAAAIAATPVAVAQTFVAQGPAIFAPQDPPPPPSPGGGGCIAGVGCGGGNASGGQGCAPINGVQSCGGGGPLGGFGSIPGVGTGGGGPAYTG